MAWSVIICRSTNILSDRIRGVPLGFDSISIPIQTRVTSLVLPHISVNFIGTSHIPNTSRGMLPAAVKSGLMTLAGLSPCWIANRWLIASASAAESSRAWVSRRFLPCIWQETLKDRSTRSIGSRVTGWVNSVPSCLSPDMCLAPTSGGGDS